MFVVSNNVGFINSLTVFFNIVLDLSDVLLNLGSSWVKEIFNEIITTLDVDFSITNLLVKGENLGVVFSGSSSEINLEFIKGIIQVINQVFKGFNQFLNWSLNHVVELDKFKKGLTVLS